MIDGIHADFFEAGLPDTFTGLCAEPSTLTDTPFYDDMWRQPSSMDSYFALSSAGVDEGSLGWHQTRPVMNPAASVDELLNHVSTGLAVPTNDAGPAFLTEQHDMYELMDRAETLNVISPPFAMTETPRRQPLVSEPPSRESGSPWSECDSSSSPNSPPSPSRSDSDSGADGSHSVSPPPASPESYSYNDDYSESSSSSKRRRIKGASVNPKYAQGRNHVCSECSARFLCKSKLNRHMLTHTGVKPFGCFCGKSFNQKSSLKNHTRRHIKKKTLPENVNIALEGINGFSLQALA